MLDFRMATFLAVCTTQNYTRAAEKIGITQPAVTQHMHYLEKYYGAKLFRLNGKKVELTAAGELLKAATEAFSNDEKQLRQQMQKKAEQELPLCIGATVTIGEFVLAPLLARYERQHPRQTIKVTVANTTELLNKLQEGSIQLALVEGYFDKSAYGSRLYRTERFIPVAAAAHHFAKEPKTLQSLQAERLLLREMGSGTREIFTRSLAAANYRLEDFASYTEVNSINTILQLVLEDAGITFLYEAAVKKEMAAGLLQEIPLSDYRIFHDFTFLWDKNSIYAPRYEQICEELGK